MAGTRQPLNGAFNRATVFLLALRCVRDVMLYYNRGNLPR